MAIILSSFYNNNAEKENMKYVLTRKMKVMLMNNFSQSIILLSLVSGSGEEESEEFESLQSCNLGWGIQQFKHGPHSALKKKKYF